jgi:hypothetical protein
MTTSIWTRLTVLCLTACVVAAVAAPATGQTLRRDGSKAVPFVADVGAQPGAGQTVLRRDGSKAVPFVADLGPEAAAQAAGRFHWGDAAIGAGLGAGVALLAMAGARAARVRRTFRPRSPGTGVPSN